VVSIAPVETDLKYYLYSIGLGLNNLGEIRKNVTWIEHIWKMAISYHEWVIIFYIILLFIFLRKSKMMVNLMIDFGEVFTLHINLLKNLKGLKKTKCN
jgi:hypothetical protein